MLTGKRFLITGATGRLGCDLAVRLEALGAEIIPLVTPSYPDKPKRTPWLAQTAPLIFRQADDLVHLSPPDYVINLHWQVKRDISFTQQLVFETEHNIHQLHALWTWLSDTPVQHFVNISSVRVFSDLNGKKASAEMLPRPRTPYGIVKCAAETFFDAHFAGQCAVSHLRLSAVAAVGEHPTQLISRLYHSAYAQQAMKVNIGHATSLLYIDEVIDLMINAALQTTGRRYILAPEAIDNAKIAATFEACSGKKLTATYENLAPDAQDITLQSDIDLLSASWVRHTALEQLIQHFIQRKNT